MALDASIYLEIIELCKIIAPALTIPVAIVSLLITGRPAIKQGSVIWFGMALLFFLCATSYAIGTGACVVGSFVEGSGICSFKPKGGSPLDPVVNFWYLQVVYFVPFALSFFISLCAFLVLLPGHGDASQRFLFVLTCGLKGQWLTPSQLDCPKTSLLGSTRSMDTGNNAIAHASTTSEAASLVATVRALAAKQIDPAEKASLFDSAKKIEDTDRMVQGVLAHAHETLRNSQAALDSIKRRNDLPTWVVHVVLITFFASLAYIAVKHHL